MVPVDLLAGRRVGCLLRFDTFDSNGLQVLSFLSSILTPSPLPGKQLDSWFPGLITRGEGQGPQAQPLLCNPELTQNTPGSSCSGEEAVRSGHGWEQGSASPSRPHPHCCSTGMLGTGIGSRCGLPGWTSGGLLFPSSPACSSHRLGSFPCVLGLERKWG